MSSITRWMGRIGVAAAIAATMAACADPMGISQGGRAGPEAMVACGDGGDTCGGGGGGGGSGVPNAKLMWFEDVKNNPSGEYYEIRNEFWQNNGPISYNAQWWHGNSSWSNEFTLGADLGHPFPCFGSIHVTILRNHVNFFGHVDGAVVIGTLTVNEWDNNKPLEYTDNQWGTQAVLRYAWTACT